MQASEFHYATPRDNKGPYTAVEVGFPSQEEPDLMNYAEDASKPTKTVYGYVPFKLVLAVIEKHGGMVSGELPAQVK